MEYRSLKLRVIDSVIELEARSGFSGARRGAHHGVRGRPRGVSSPVVCGREEKRRGERVGCVSGNDLSVCQMEPSPVAHQADPALSNGHPCLLRLSEALFLAAFILLLKPLASAATLNFVPSLHLSVWNTYAFCPTHTCLPLLPSPPVLSPLESSIPSSSFLLSPSSSN